MIITNQNERIGKWVAERIGNVEPFHMFQAIGIERDGSIVGGAIIDNYIKDSRCSVHCAGDGVNWCNREFLFVVFDYIFRQLKCNAVLNIVDGTNAASIRFTGHIGFKEVHRIPGGGKGGSDGVMFQMLESDCKWHKLRGKK